MHGAAGLRRGTAGRQHVLRLLPRLHPGRRPLRHVRQGKVLRPRAAGKRQGLSPGAAGRACHTYPPTHTTRATLRRRVEVCLWTASLPWHVCRFIGRFLDARASRLQGASLAHVPASPDDARACHPRALRFTPSMCNKLQRKGIVAARLGHPAQCAPGRTVCTGPHSHVFGVCVCVCVCVHMRPGRPRGGGGGGSQRGGELRRWRRPWLRGRICSRVGPCTSCTCPCHCGAHIQLGSWCRLWS